MQAPLFAWADTNVDIEQLQLESLPDTTFIPASKIAQQVSNAPSAVSIVTAQDIHDYGYRTLAEVLNSMRGVFVTQDYAYNYLGGRGYGFPGEYAGRIVLLIDGYRAQDGYFEQAFLGQDGFLDLAVIERVEYIPGAGAVGYGDGTSLGVVNIITKKGKDFNRLQVAGAYGSHQTGQARFTYGKQLENGADVLVSVSGFESNGRDYRFGSIDLFDGFGNFMGTNPPSAQKGDAGEQSQRLFFKGSYEGWGLEAAWVNRQLEIPTASDLGVYQRATDGIDKNAYVRLKNDTQISPHLKLSSQAYFGKYYNEFQTFDQFKMHYNIDWSGLGAQFVGTWFDQHTFVFGADYRNDYHQNASFGEDLKFNFKRKTYSIYGYDDYVFDTHWKVNVGARYTASDNSMRMWSPRTALIYTPQETTTLKLSYAVSRRQETAYELLLLDAVIDPEVTRTAELVWEQTLGWQSKLTASAYRYAIDSRILAADPDAPSIVTKGIELQYDKAWQNGIRLRASWAKQYSSIGEGKRPLASPEDLVKLNVSAPLLGERLRAGLDVRGIGDRRLFVFPQSDYTGGYTLADLTFTSTNLLPNLNATFSIKNLFDKKYGDPTTPRPDGSLQFPHDARNYWLQLEYNFK